jgi:hypothetical protein
MWYRVFGSNHAVIPPADLLEALNGQGFAVTGHFRGDDEGWFRAELILAEGSIEAQRYLATEEGIRRELNSWAAWVEDTLGEEKGGLWMQRIISTTQIFTLRAVEADKTLEDFLSAACRYLAGMTEGFYQVDGKGFFTSEGSLAIAEVL